MASYTVGVVGNPAKATNPRRHNMSEKKVSKLSRENLTGDAGALFTFADGTSIEAALNSFSPEMVNQLACHGLKAKVGDTVADKSIVGDVLKVSVSTVIDQLVSGIFNRSGGGGGNGGDSVRAIASLKGRTIEEAAAFWASADEDTQKAIRGHAKVKAFIASAKAERAAAAAANAEDDGMFS